MNRNVLAPSILAADFCELGQEIQLTEQAGARYLHYDVMDGKFVPNISFGTIILKSIRKITKQVIDVHLMVQEPCDETIEDFAQSGADIITIHLEACADVEKTLKKVKSQNVRCGISIKPHTPVSALIPYLSLVDMVLLMTVEPGKGGQAFIQESMDKVRELKALISKKNLAIDIEVDGGIHSGNIQEVMEAGANIFVAGSAVFNGDIVANTRAMMGIIEKDEEASCNS